MQRKSLWSDLETSLEYSFTNSIKLYNNVTQQQGAILDRDNKYKASVHTKLHDPQEFNIEM